MLDYKKFDVIHRDLYKLDKIKKAAAATGHPELGRSTFLVGGTNGKGSVVAYLSAWLQKLNYKVGLSISPHVIDESERIQINSQAYSKEKRLQLEKKYEDALKDLSFFERFTLLSFLAFREENVDVQVIEVGIGGRLDATNICDPDVSIICSIGTDHQELLGNSYREIAIEKAGIMRPRRKCFVPETLPQEAMAAIQDEAEKTKSSLCVISQNGFEILRKTKSEHQQMNALLAFSALQSFCEMKAVRTLDQNQAELVALETGFPGRTQLLSKNPVWLVDGGHNREALIALQGFLKQHFPKQRFKVIFGMMRDKDPALIELLRPWIEELYFPQFFMERQWTPEELEERLLGQKTSNLRELLEGFKAQKTSVLVCGSFYLAGDVLRILSEEN
ncbi:MAG: bifunctional folylpolyglutamate synthase/dihydrofolate synthase [Bdellovibrionota bacterium]